QLADTQARQEAYENRLAQLKEMEKAQDTEIKRLRQQLAGSSAGKEELAAKDSEIKRLNAQLADTQARQEAYENRLAQFKKIESDMQRLESETEERRKSSHDIKRRVEESRMKMRLLSEKAKENVELLASFAGGKEFDEFRKSIHLDEIIQKHEDEIKELRIKNMDLEKGIK
ncbi:MAG: hypothetical protein NTY34_01650, partial [Candidatus Omnitrophica bacterium]|nr:hypothetical protein [Candidatus Omnitrophota bacterium]